MGIFSSLSGNNYHLNSILKPINSELADRIRALNPSVEQTGFTIAFDAATKIIMNLFHPDTGLFKTVIKQLEKDNMRKIYEILMLYILIDMCTREDAVEELEKEKVIKTASIVFGLTEHKINELCSLFDNLSLKESIPLLWESICRLSNKDLRDSDNLYIFATIYRDSLDIE
jgi:predicted nuclease with TOPRIM domain